MRKKVSISPEKGDQPRTSRIIEHLLVDLRFGKNSKILQNLIKFSNKLQSSLPFSKNLNISWFRAAWFSVHVLIWSKTFMLELLLNLKYKWIASYICLLLRKSDQIGKKCTKSWSNAILSYKAEFQFRYTNGSVPIFYTPSRDIMEIGLQSNRQNNQPLCVRGRLIYKIAKFSTQIQEDSNRKMTIALHLRMRPIYIIFLKWESQETEEERAVTRNFFSYFQQLINRW